VTGDEVYGGRDLRRAIRALGMGYVLAVRSNHRLTLGCRVLLETVRDTAARELAAADSRVYEFSVTTFPLGGPSLMLLIASRTQVANADSATAYLTRCRRMPAYLDQHAARLRTAARDSLMPVAPLVSDAIRQLNDHLSHPERDPVLTCRPPEGWAGTPAWQEEVERVIRDEVRPAIGRYADLLAELLPRCRPPEQAGLLYVPGGVPAYASCVRNGTTLPFDPDELHRLGLVALAEIEEQIGELGRAALGTSDVDDIMVRFRKDSALTAPDGAAAMARAAAAIARAEERLPDMFRSPLPPPCAVEPMPPHMAGFGAPPYYSPPGPGWLPARRVPVQRRAARTGGKLGPGGHGFPRRGTRTPRAVRPGAAPAAPAAAAGRVLRCAAR
jgi:uncharacterized protein (DUF885 family)